MEVKNFLNREETIRYLGYKDAMPDDIMMEEIIECEEKLIEVLEPKYLYQVYPIERVNEKLYVASQALELVGSAIKKHLEGCEFVALSCATLGEKVDELIDVTQKENMLHALILDALCNAAIEEVRLLCEQVIAEEYKEYTINWQFGIGYGDLPLKLQDSFVELIDAKKKIGLTTNQSSLLVPLKSVSGFIGLKKKDENHMETKERKLVCRGTCATCSMNKTCTFKRKTI